MLMMCAPGRRNASAGLSSRFPQSRNTIVRPSRSSGGELARPESSNHWYSCGSGNSLSSMNIWLSRPWATRISCIAISDPSASPSGFSWLTTISFSAEPSSASTSSRFAPEPLSPIRVLRESGPSRTRNGLAASRVHGAASRVHGAARRLHGVAARRPDLVDQLRDPHPTIDRLVVLERDRGRVLERQLGAHPPLEKAVCGAQALERVRPCLLVPEDAHVDARVTKIGAGLDGSDGHESNAWILEIFGDRVAEHLSNGLVDAPHPAVRHPTHSPPV